MTNTWRRWLAAVFMVVLLGGTLAGCSDDDGGAVGTTDETAGQDGGDEQLAAACDAEVEINEGFGKMFEAVGEPPPGDGPPPADFVEKVQKAYDENIGPAIEKLKANAPAEIKPKVDRGAEILADFRTAPDPSKLESEEFQLLGSEIDTYFYDACDNGFKGEVRTTEYAFAGLGALESGTVWMKIDNSEGKEAHEVVLLKRKDGVTESFDEILEKPQEEAQKLVDTAFLGFALPGKVAASVSTDVEPGDYLAVCFIPKGMTDPDKEVDGPPHFTLGMRQEVKVG